MSTIKQCQPAQNSDTDDLTILGHLNELRIRLTWGFAGLAITTIASFFWVRSLLLWMIGLARGLSLVNASVLSNELNELVVLGPTEGIQVYFKVALLSGAVLAMPWLILQLWLFIAPGLTKKERRHVYVFVLSASVLFALGVLFTVGVLMPTALSFLGSFEADIFRPEWTANEYIRFVTNFIFWIGVSFELPILIYFMALFGLVNSKQLLEHWRVAVVAIAVVAAMITPTVDPVTMTLTMAPLLVLYFLSIGLAKVGYRKFEKSVEF